jgi:hypothetical protein
MRRRDDRRGAQTALVIELRATARADANALA